MSGKSCAVGTCKNSGKCPNISFHRFPRDQKLRKVWILKCRREDRFNPDTSRICSVHFKPEEFERDLQGELLGFRPKAILKPNVVPTLNLKDGGVNVAVGARQKRMLKKNEKEKHNCLVESALQAPSASLEIRGSVCSVATCNNASVSRTLDDNVQFFTFPKDAKLRRDWIKICFQPENFNPTNKRICSNHFKADDFEDEIEAKIQNRLPKLLKHDCIPSLNLKPEKNLSVCLGDNKKIRWERAAKKRQKEFLKKFLEAEKEQDHEPENVKSKNKSDDTEENGMMDTDRNYERDLVGDKDLERRVSQFISSKVQILFAELL